VTVALAITPDGRWDVGTAELIAATAAAGFDALGIIAERAGADAAAAYRAAGLGCHELLALLLGDDESEALRAAERLADAAAAMGATWVLTAFLAPLSPRTETIIERCASTFAAAGAGMAVEVSPVGPVSTIPQALEIVRVANRGGGRAGLLIDSWHFCVGGSTWEDLALVPLDTIAYVQFADALAPASDSLRRETLHRRALPGEGVLELGRFASTLLDRGWEGTVSAEVLSSELRTRPITDIVRRIHDTIAPYWR
jgi:sugar phosphate isomerase/epimerase